MGVSDWITLGIGSYAAIVATTALIWNILRERRKVKVKVNYALGVRSLDGREMILTGFDSLNGREMILIKVINKGLRDINIQEYGFFCSDKKTHLIDPTTIHSGRVKSGDSMSYYIPIQTVKDMVRDAKEKKGLSIIGAYVRDTTSIYYKARINKKTKERFFKV